MIRLRYLGVGKRQLHRTESLPGQLWVGEFRFALLTGPHDQVVILDEKFIREIRAFLPDEWTCMMHVDHYVGLLRAYYNGAPSDQHEYEIREFFRTLVEAIAATHYKPVPDFVVFDDLLERLCHA